MSPRRATMNDVAKLAGVTQATVSYVINDSANISDEVKARVYAAIKELDYSPNYNARALKTNRSNIIGIILPDIVNPYYARMVELLEQVFIKTNHHTMVYVTSYNPKYEKDIIHRLLSCDVYGIIVLYQLTDAANWNILRQSGKSIIALEGGKYCSEIGIPCVLIDSFYGGYTATKYLIEKGSKKIAFIHQTAVNETLHDRFRGYRKAMEEAGRFDSDDIFYVESSFNIYEEGKKIGSQVAVLPYDAIFASSDLIAVGVIKQLILHGKKVPEDVSVIGYDDIPLAELFIPALTTMVQPLKEVCQLIVQILLPKDGETPPNLPLLKPSLVIRESV